MKRSEMLKIIDSLLQPWYGSSASWDEKGRTCEHFLNTIEKAGMLPPKTLIKTLSGYSDYTGRDILYRQMLNEWEPETK